MGHLKRGRPTSARARASGITSCEAVTGKITDGFRGSSISIENRHFQWEILRKSPFSYHGSGGFGW